MDLTGSVSRSVLVVDDEPSILSALRNYLRLQGYTVFAAASAEAALEEYAAHRPSVVVTDLKMPGMGGDQLLLELKKLDDLMQVIIITGFATIEGAVDSLKAGAFDYIIKPFRLEVVGHAVARAFDHISLLIANRRLQEDSLHVLEAMVKTLEQRDFYTAGHSRRVTSLADAMAAEIGLDENERRIMHLGGLIHDVGKIGIDDAILRKPGKLTREEYDIIKSHPGRGVEIIQPLEFLRETVPIIMHHHERYDGSGYPAGLAHEEIPLGARILTVADTYDAMTSSRAYRKALPPGAALDELQRCRGNQFDPDIVGIFLSVHPGAGVPPPVPGPSAGLVS